MATIGRGRGRGGGMVAGNPGGGGGNGPNPNNNGAPRRGSWRGGPPGAGPPGSGSIQRGASPAVNNVATGPRTSIADHMNDLRKVDDPSKPAGGKSFQTDADISNSSRGGPRELQPWVSDHPEPLTPNKTNGSAKDAETFGGGGNGQWDQFATNERLFGATSDYKEELYTTKLNKSGPDFKKREKEAEKLAHEILNATASNPHTLEERNQLVEDWSKDEEERFSGVTRAPNAYVPPGARRPQAGPGATTATAARPSPSSAATASGALPKTNGSSTTISAPPAAPAIERSTSETPQPTESPGTSAVPAVDSKEKIPGVVDKFREFVGVEREKIEAKKQTVVKSERDRHMAELKKFHSDFKVPLPIPKDILPILSKDSEKQKAIEAKVADGVVAARQQAEQRKVALSKSPSTSTSPAKPTITTPSKKIPMKIAEIPPFGGPRPKAPVLPIPETASQNIQLSVSPTPSSGSQVSTQPPKLNPGASAFVFKPNPGAAAFKPTEPKVTSPPAQSAKLPAQPVQPVQSAQPVASTSSNPPNPFFGNQVPTPHARGAINVRDDFNPWKNGTVPNPASVLPQWPYTGRKYSLGYPGLGPAHAPPPIVPVFDEEAAHGPPVMQGMPPNYPPYGYRFNPGIPMGGQMGNPMFSPGPQYAPLPGGPMQQAHQHIPQGQQPNGMPMYFNNGMPQHPNFVPPQFHYNTARPPLPVSGPGSQIQQPQGPGPGLGPGGPNGPGGLGGGPGPQIGPVQPGQGPGHGGPGMFYHPQGQIPTPQQTPQSA